MIQSWYALIIFRSSKKTIPRTTFTVFYSSDTESGTLNQVSRATVHEPHEIWRVFTMIKATCLFRLAKVTVSFIM